MGATVWACTTSLCSRRCTVHRQLLQEVALRQMLDKASPCSARREWEFEGGEGSAPFTHYVFLNSS